MNLSNLKFASCGFSVFGVLLAGCDFNFPSLRTATEAMSCKNAELEGKIAYKPDGCFRCAGRGIRGRTGLFEFFKPDVEISSAISEGANEAALFNMCRERNVNTLFEDGIAKCLAGIVSLQEVHRVAGVF